MEEVSTEHVLRKAKCTLPALPWTVFPLLPSVSTLPSPGAELLRTSLGPGPGLWEVWGLGSASYNLTYPHQPPSCASRQPRGPNVRRLLGFPNLALLPGPSPPCSESSSVAPFYLWMALSSLHRLPFFLLTSGEKPPSQGFYAVGSSASSPSPGPVTRLQAGPAHLYVLPTLPLLPGFPILHRMDVSSPLGLLILLLQLSQLPLKSPRQSCN